MSQKPKRKPKGGQGSAADKNPPINVPPYYNYNESSTSSAAQTATTTTAPLDSSGKGGTNAPPGLQNGGEVNPSQQQQQQNNPPPNAGKMPPGGPPQSPQHHQMHQMHRSPSAPGGGGGNGDPKGKGNSPPNMGGMNGPPPSQMDQPQHHHMGQHPYGEMPSIPGGPPPPPQQHHEMPKESEMYGPGGGGGHPMHGGQHQYQPRYHDPNMMMAQDPYGHYRTMGGKPVMGQQPGRQPQRYMGPPNATVTNNGPPPPQQQQQQQPPPPQQQGGGGQQQGPTPTLNSLLQSHPPPPSPQQQPHPPPQQQQHRYPPNTYDQQQQQQPPPNHPPPPPPSAYGVPPQQGGWAPPPRPYSPQMGGPQQQYRPPPPAAPSNSSRGGSQSPYSPPGPYSQQGPPPPNSSQGPPPPPQSGGPPGPPPGSAGQYSGYPQRYPTPPGPPNHRSPYPQPHQYSDPARGWPGSGQSPTASPGPSGHPPPSPQSHGHPPQSPGHAAPSPSPQPVQSPHQESTGQNSNDSSSGVGTGIGTTPGTPNSQAMRPTPSPTGSSGSRSMSPAVGGQPNVQMPSRPSSSHSLVSTQTPPLGGANSVAGSNSGATQYPPPPQAGPPASQQSSEPASSRPPPPSQQQQSPMTAGQGSYQTPPQHMQQHGGYKMGPNGPTGMPPQAMSPYPPGAGGAAQQQQGQYQPGNYSPRPQYPGSYGSPGPGQPPPPSNSIPPGGGQYPTANNRPMSNSLPQQPPHSQYQPYQQQQQQQSWGAPQNPPSNHVQQQQQQPGKGGVGPPQQQQQSGQQQGPGAAPQHQPQGAQQPGVGGGGGGPPNSQRPLNYLKQHLQHKQSPTPPQAAGYGNGPGMHPPMGPPHMGLPPPNGPTNMGPPTAPQNVPQFGQQGQPGHHNNSHSEAMNMDGGPQDNGITSSGSNSGPGGGHGSHPVTSLVTTGPDGPLIDEASQQSTLSNASAASADDPQCSTPKVRKGEAFNQSHLAANTSSPSTHGPHEDFEMASPTWNRTPASPVFNSHVPQDTSYRTTSKKSDSLCKLYDMDDNPERRTWLDKLLSYMEEKRTPIPSCPTISKQPLDLYKLYILTKERGGYIEVTKSKTWKDIAGLLSIGASSSAAYTLRKHYSKFILAFECQYDRGGVDPLQVMQQAEAGSKKKSAKNTSVPSPVSVAGSSNSQDSFPPPGSSNASMDGYNNYPGGYPTNATPDYNASNIQRPPSQTNSQSHPGNAPSTSGDNISVSNPFDDPVGPSRVPYQQSTPFSPVTRPQGMAYPNQPGAYPQYGAPDQFAPVPPSGQYPPPPGHQGQFPPNRTMYPGYGPEGENSGAPAPNAAVPPNANDPYRGYGTNPASYGQPRTYPQQPQAGAPPSSTGNVPSPQGAGPQPQGPQGSYPDYRPSPDQNAQPRRHPDFEKQPQSYSPYPQRAPMYGWPNNAQYRGQYPPPTGSQQWSGQGQRPPGPAGGPNASGQTPNWDRYPQNQQGPYPANQQGQPHWGSMGPGGAQSPIRGVDPNAMRQHQQQQQQMQQQQQQRQKPMQMMPPQPGAPPGIGGKPGMPGGPFMGQSAVPPKRDIVFPVESVEATVPVLYRRKRITKNEIGSVDPWRIFMALRSGLLGESTWALDVINILLFDDTSVQYFGLTHLPGLLNLLLDHFQKSLADMFDPDDIDKRHDYGWCSNGANGGAISASSSNITTAALLTATKRRRKDGGGAVPVNGQAVEEIEEGGNVTERRLSGIKEEDSNNNNNGDDISNKNRDEQSGEKCTQSKLNNGPRSRCSHHSCDMKLLDLGSVTEIPDPANRILVLQSTTNYTLTSRKGVPVKINPQSEEDVFVLDTKRDWDVDADKAAQLATTVGIDPWTHGHIEPYPHDYLMSCFRAEVVHIPFARLIKGKQEHESSTGGAAAGEETKCSSSNSNTSGNNSNCMGLSSSENNQCNSSNLKKIKSEPCNNNNSIKSSSSSSSPSSKNNSSSSNKMNSICNNVAPSRIGGRRGRATSPQSPQSQNAATNSNLSKKVSETTSPLVVEVKKESMTDSDCREVDMDIEPRLNGPLATATDEEKKIKLEKTVEESKSTTDLKMRATTEATSEQEMDIDDDEVDENLFNIKKTVRDPAAVLKRRRMSDYEDECYTRDEASLYLVTESQDSLARRCVGISNILRNLTFVPGNELEFANSSTFLSVLGKLLLLNHDHPVRTQKTRNYDREEDCDFSDSCSSLAAETEWWWDYLVQVRENMLVAAANISGYVELSKYDEVITRPVLDGLLHWAICPSAHGQDPFPTCGVHSQLSPQRLALEALCKLCVTDANVDLVIATPPFSRLEKLCAVLTRHLCKNEEQVLREFSVNLLHYLVAADSSMARTVALQSPCISYLVAFIEQAEQTALGVANQHGINFLRENPDSMGTSLDMLRRAAGTLLHLARHPDNRPLFMQQEQRLLALVMSHILDQQVALIISRVLFQVSRGQGPILSTHNSLASGSKAKTNGPMILNGIVGGGGGGDNNSIKESNNKAVDPGSAVGNCSSLAKSDGKISLATSPQSTNTSSANSSGSSSKLSTTMNYCNDANSSSSSNSSNNGGDCNSENTSKKNHTLLNATNSSLQSRTNSIVDPNSIEHQQQQQNSTSNDSAGSSILNNPAKVASAVNNSTSNNTINCKAPSTGAGVNSNATPNPSSGGGGGGGATTNSSSSSSTSASQMLASPIVSISS